MSNRRLRAHLPYPESAALRMKRGLPVRIRSPQVPGKVVEGVVDDLRPTVTEGSRALDVIARFDNPGGFLSGGTVNAAVVVDARQNVVVVPEQSVVLRPGRQGGLYRQRGQGEPARGGDGREEGGRHRDRALDCRAGETVALDGAGFLTDGAAGRACRKRRQDTRRLDAQT
ncbi:MAG: hypothetical protein MZW92_19975 [Comamonadaceae bacterium]|nr:hypothetical protein [Comamonadaceae bacterium]